MRELAERLAVPSGPAYRVTGSPECVAPALAAELARVLQRFAAEAGFSAARPVPIEFRPGVLGHHRVGRAADIYGVCGIGMDTWKRRWDAGERTSNLGWRLYDALRRYGRWSQPYGYPIQLFGPWTRSDGPWLYISDRLLAAHRDHIHVAK